MRDPFYKKTIQFEFKKHRLVFDISQSLFSSQDIDVGTQRLLRTFLNIDLPHYKKILDLGCGYGPIGISIAKEAPQSEVHMVDIDALALLYTQQNAELNTIHVKPYGSIGYDSVTDTDFDLIVSNIPAKVGRKALRSILLDAQFHVATKAMVAIVVVDAIVEETRSILHSDERVSIDLEKSWGGHSVFHYHFKEGVPITRRKDSFDDGAYDRTTHTLDYEKSQLSFLTTYNLSEFDTLSFETQFLLDHIQFLKQRAFPNIAIYHPNQGHIAVIASLIAHSKHIYLVDRNRQSLETTKRNLIQNGISTEAITLCHYVGLEIENEKPIDAIVGILGEKENKEVYEMILDQAVKILNISGKIAFGSSSTVITILEKIIKARKKNIKIVKRERSRGQSMIVLQVK